LISDLAFIIFLLLFFNHVYLFDLLLVFQSLVGVVIDNARVLGLEEAPMVHLVFECLHEGLLIELILDLVSLESLIDLRF
jgi:hypothetical protein